MAAITVLPSNDAAATTATNNTTQRAEGTATSLTEDGAAESDGEVSPRPTKLGRDRLGSESSSKAARRIPHKAPSATSKSSGGGGRQRQDSLKHAAGTAEANTTTNTTPKRGTPGQRPSHIKTVDAFLPTRDKMGTEWGVGNVGIGGKIYLKPKNRNTNVPPGPLHSPTRPRPKLRIARPNEEEADDVAVDGPEEEGEEESRTDAGDDDGDSEMADSMVAGGKAVRTDFTGRESTWTKLSNAHDARGAPSDIFRHRPRSRRSMSESTVSQVPSRSGTMAASAALAQTKALKVVIDRPDFDPMGQRQQTTSATFDGLDISIPNYQMGSPRFTEQGSPFMQSAGFAGASLHPTPAIPSPRFLENIPDGFAAQPSMTGPSPLRRQPPHLRPPASTYDESLFSLSVDAGLLPTSLDPFTLKHHPAFTGHETISPAIYDVLAAAPNDRSVVRYSPVTGEMVAATPARLIVQITAETFLDYELLSDFFLTVRSYLTIHDLLSLLLARFEWATNRWDDNGRIIRVRTFAAIRHWILNYFAYDFMPDRRLRVQFSRKMNELFWIVKSRGDAGLPDLKLISDLKKCWNGRCMLYWERPVDNSFEADLQPGGPGLEGEDGSSSPLDADNATLGSVTAASTDGVYTVPPSPHANHDSGFRSSRDSRQQTTNSHSRVNSGLTTSSAPQSPASDTTTDAAGSITAHMAAMQAQRQQQQRPQMSQRMSGGGSGEYYAGDSYGSEQPQQPVVSYPLQASAYRSVLRGHLLAPSSPYISTSQPTSHGLSSPTLSPSAELSKIRPSQSGIGGSGPGVKQFIGNIKRALSSKVSSTQYPGDVSPGVSTAGSPLQQRNDTFRNPRHLGDPNNSTSGSTLVPTNSADSTRTAMRIDLLAEQISMEFQRAMQGQFRQGQGYVPGPTQRPPEPPRISPPMIPQQPQKQADGQGSPQAERLDMLAPPEARKLPSGMTSSSQSIVIVDDTGDSPVATSRNNSVPSDHTPRGSMQVPKANEAALGLSPEPYIPQRRLSTGNIEISTQEVGSTASSARATPSRLSYAEGASQRKASHDSISMRRAASHQSSLSKSAKAVSNKSNAGDSEADKEKPQKQDNGTLAVASSTPARALRRVPGGDLRANEKIGDLEQLPRPKSTGSIATFASTRESEMMTFGDRITKTFRDRSDRPLISPALTGSFGDPFKKNVGKDDVSVKVSYMRSQSEDKAGRRPSFEALVASFAEIPDEELGGPDEALLKLEGRWSRSALAAARRASKHSAANGVAANPTGKRKPSSNSTDTLHTKPAARSTMNSTDYAGSEDSYNSTPILERNSSTPKSKTKGASRRSNLGLRPKSSSRRQQTQSFLLEENEGQNEYGSDGFRRPSDPGFSAQKPTASNGAGKPYYQMPPSGMPVGRNFIERYIGQTGGPTSQTHPAVHMPLAATLHPRHMPFVLAHDSKILCEQLTLIEKDVLREIDWRDLVEMRWQVHPSSTTNWVSYLLNGDPLGIDLVTTRFNIMVKWILSEIVLTDSVEERAQVIVKMIHIAREARRICNYATLLQFTIALTSIDCTRMKKTWALVPEAEVQTIRDLEQIVSPRRNFANLRSEMEEAPAESGCIPVLILYIHDLTYNAQRPSVVVVDLGAEAANQPRYLINFERYRNTAVIVKNLLRLIDASSRYNFVPVDDVLSHCMWIACLPDEVISSKGRAIEGVAKSDTASRGGTSGGASGAGVYR